MSDNLQWKSARALVISVAAFGSCLALALLAPAVNNDAARAQGPNPSAIQIASQVPGELNPGGGGAPAASLAQAAAFAWQEFIALNWPAKIQNGAIGDRDTPASDCLLGGAPSPGPGAADCSTRPLTWQTFRGKAEIFNKLSPQPGYDQLPNYTGEYSATIKSCDGSPEPKRAAWVNLDETTQIDLDAMYAGIGVANPTPQNSAPQLVRFLAKANRSEFDYVQTLTKSGGYNVNLGGLGRPLRAATVKYFQTQGNPPAGGTTYVSLPNNTIEIKAGWRMLNPAKEDARRYHTARVRYYEPSGNQQCYREGMWALVALHIIQKTASAPYFIYASFEQADNIRTGDGRPVEDPDGRVVVTPGCRSGQAAPCHTSPAVALNDTATVNPNKTMIPPNIVRTPSNSPYCTSGTSQRPGNQLYYLNTAAFAGLPSGGYVCINDRDNPIPPVIVQANAQAHAAIAAWNRKYGITNSPWAYYKLVNIQYVPIDKTKAGPFTPTSGNTSCSFNTNTACNPESYYLANIVVETNGSLQTFSGGLVGAIGGIGGTGSNSDYASQFGESGGGTHKNTYYNATGHNMGGCMGCHGSQAQSLGGDFSVILARGPVLQPEPLPSISSAGARTNPPKSRRLVFGH